MRRPCVDCSAACLCVAPVELVLRAGRHAHDRFPCALLRTPHREDPYKALQGQPGYSWLLAESSAAKLGHDPGSPARGAAALLQALHNVAASEGHTHLPWQDLQAGEAPSLDPCLVGACFDGGMHTHVGRPTPVLLEMPTRDRSPSHYARSTRNAAPASQQPAAMAEWGRWPAGRSALCAGGGAAGGGV